MFSCELWNFIAQPYSTLHIFVNKHTSYIKNKSLRQFEMYSFLKISLPLIVSCSYVLSIFVSLLTFYCNLTLQYVLRLSLDFPCYNSHDFPSCLSLCELHLVLNSLLKYCLSHHFLMLSIWVCSLLIVS